MAGPEADQPGAGDPFGTRALRASVLAAWRGSHTRFREDANAEEDLARGGYRDRLVVELAQNAADAAVRSGEPGRLLLRLRDGLLEASNTGAALDVDGVRSLASLRASAKRDEAGAAGRFGVGFAAVLAVCDEPQVRSAGGGVRFSAEQTRALVAAEPALVDELHRRGAHTPVLRLPFAEPAAPEPGFTTTVVLPLRDPGAVELAHRLLEDVDDALLLGLPALAEVVVEVGAHHRRRLRTERHGEDVVVRDGSRTSRWRVVTATGLADPGVLRDRPVEERTRPAWTVTWAVPLDDAGHPAPVPAGVPAVLHAPTPTDEPLGLPALLIASFPLDPARRHVAAGPLTDLLVTEAATSYVEVVGALARTAGAAALRLVPGPAPVGALDGHLRAAVLERLRRAPLLPAAEDAEHRLRAADAVVLDPPDVPVVAALAPVVDGMVAAAWSRDTTVLDVLGVRRLPVADVLDALADTDREPGWWHSLYDALSATPAVLLEGLPVPLVDGRTVRGPRSALLPGDEVPAEDLAALGPRIVHPDAAHPLLRRLGCATAEPHRLLADRQLLDRLPDADDTLVDVVLRTVEAAGLAPGEVPGLAELPLPLADGGHARAGDCVLPGSPLAAVRDPEVPLADDALLATFRPGTLLAVGVLDRLRVHQLDDVEVDPETLAAAVTDGGDWADFVLDAVADAGAEVESPPLASSVPVVAGLDLVADGAWPQAHRLLAEPDVRRALVDPVVVHPVSGPAVEVPSPAAWWLREAPLLGGRLPVHTRLAGADALLSGLYPTVAESADLDDRLLAAVGVRTTVAALLAEPDGPAELLERLADPDLLVAAEDVVALHRALAGLPESRWPAPPAVVRVPSGAGSAVLPAADVEVVVAPHHAQLGSRTGLPGTERLADLLDVASSTGSGGPVTGGREAPVPEVARAVLASSPPTYREHDELVVAGTVVEWWVGDDGTVHASTGHGLARGLAWATGSWSRRWELEAALADADRWPGVLAERAFD